MDDKQKYHKKLEEISHISLDQAKKMILDEARNESRAEVAKIIRETEEEAKHEMEFWFSPEEIHDYKRAEDDIMF